MKAIDRLRRRAHARRIPLSIDTISTEVLDYQTDRTTYELTGEVYLTYGGNVFYARCCGSGMFADVYEVNQAIEAAARQALNTMHYN